MLIEIGSQFRSNRSHKIVEVIDILVNEEAFLVLYHGSEVTRKVPYTHLTSSTGRDGFVKLEEKVKKVRRTTALLMAASLLRLS